MFDKSKQLHPTKVNVLLLVAKVPTPGYTKTRLQPLLGQQGAAECASALLSDVMSSMEEVARLSGAVPGLYPVKKMIVFAPDTPLARAEMESHVLRVTGLEASPENGWTLTPMVESRDNETMKSRDLGAKLSAALATARETHHGPAGETSVVAFIGMDSPGLQPSEIVHSFTVAQQPLPSTATSTLTAYISPARDGGYVLLSLPAGSPPTVFQNVEWSAPQTCVSQIKALSLAGCYVSVGKTGSDVDEVCDLIELGFQCHEGGVGGGGGRVKAFLERKGLAVPRPTAVAAAAQSAPPGETKGEQWKGWDGWGVGLGASFVLGVLVGGVCGLRARQTQLG